jgi:hypothetical protein
LRRFYFVRAYQRKRLCFVHLEQNGAEVTVRVDVAVRDLARIMPLDGDRDDSVSWGEVVSQQERIAEYFDAHLVVLAGSAPFARVNGYELLAVEHSDGH